jgi:ribosomal protein S25
VLRFARSHRAVCRRELGARYGLGVGVGESLLQRLTEAGA